MDLDLQKSEKLAEHALCVDLLHGMRYTQRKRPVPQGEKQLLGFTEGSFGDPGFARGGMAKCVQKQTSS